MMMDDVEALESRGILLKTESHAVSVLGGVAALPAEVARVLEDSGEYPLMLMMPLTAPTVLFALTRSCFTTSRLLHGPILGPHRPRDWVCVPRREAALLCMVNTAGED